MNPPQHFALRLAFFASPPTGLGDHSTDTAPYVTAEEFISLYGKYAELIPQRHSAISLSASFCGPVVSLVGMHKRPSNALGSSFLRARALQKNCRILDRCRRPPTACWKAPRVFTHCR
jgi:hypothetical protein